MSQAGFSWTNAAINALSSFETSAGAHPQLPITLPQSTYDPGLSSNSFFDFGLGLNDPRLAPSNDDNGGYASGVSTSSMMPYNEQHQRDLWGGFALNQGFSAHAQGTGGYVPGPPACDDATFQFIRMPSRSALPIIPIYETTASPYNNNATPPQATGSASLLQADILRTSNPNLYPQNAMPLTIKHPEFTQQQQQQQQTKIDEDAWAAHIMNNVERLEHSAHLSAHNQQPPLTISQSHPQSYAHHHQQQLYPAEQQQQMQYTVEQIEHALLYQSANSNDPNDLSKLYEQMTANLHDEVAASRLNSGNKEIATLPSAIPSVPSLHVRYPPNSQRFAQNHPYTSPRFSAQPLPPGGGRPGGAGARSVRPVVPRITTSNSANGVMMVLAKREHHPLSVPAPMTTAYLAGLRRPIPLSEAASERAPVEPYGHPRQASASAGLPYPLLPPSSASTTASSLPPESPFSSSFTALPPNGAQSRSRPGSISPKKEPGVLLPSVTAGAGGNAEGGSLRLNRGQERPNTAASSHSGGSMLSPRMNSAERAAQQQSQSQSQQQLQPQARATAARKRADDDILQHSFRAEGDWRRRMILEAVLSSTFVSDNTLEPVSGGPAGTGAGSAGASSVTTTGESPTSAGSMTSVNTNANAIALAGLGLDASLGSPGKSIYAVFLEQVEKSEWRCLFGDREHPCPSQAVAFRRLERALDHVRSHLNHRPFGCKGECQKGDSCDARFFARSHLQDHVKRTESACCETCGQVIRIQNMPRHRLAH